MRTVRSLAALGLAIAATATVASTPTATAAPQPDRGGYTFAVIGDVPYGADQIAAFPGWIRQINADPDVRSAVHVGDIKNGSSLCTTEYFRMIRADFDTFEDPLVYTPGDNEWTDCHRTSNGAYHPLERLATVRDIFFDHPGTTMGRNPMGVHSQAAAGFPENVSYRQSGVTFLAADVPGSNNGLQPWDGLGYTQPTPEQVKAVHERTEADVRELHRAFEQARRGHRTRGVVVMQQADMFDPTFTPTANDISAFRPWVQALVHEASSFRGPVYLFNGDSHVYNSDRPLGTGSPWLSAYDVQGSADNLTRVTVDGSSNNKDWLKVSVNRPGSASLLRWTRVPYTS